MQRYANRAGDSGVTAYQLERGSIVVQFKDGWRYEYTHASAGPDAVSEMQRLAASGRGLSTYISQNVSDKFSRKFRQSKGA